MSGTPENLSKARTYKTAGWVLIIIGFLISIPLTPLVGAVPLFIGYLLLRKGKKYSVEGGEVIMKNDNRSPVLYLRSFNDEVEDRSMTKYVKSLSISNKKDLALTVPPIGFREQDALGYVFRKVGPYIALGKPGERIPELGSSKIYVPNESWQSTIREFFRKSKLIIFRAGKTEGLKWELKELVQTVKPQKIVMILPVKDEDYSIFIQWANPIMLIALPQEYPSSRMVIFDEKWNPSCLRQGQTLTKSFAPFLEQNGISVRETYWEKILEHNGIRW